MAFWRRRKSDAELSLERLQAGAGVPTHAPASDPAPAGPFSMTVEDVFTIKGRGTVVTGRVEAGTLQVGAPVTIATASGPLSSIVTGIEQFRKSTQVASAGENVGLLLQGVTGSDVARGDVVSAR